MTLYDMSADSILDQGSVLVARAKMECSNLSPSDVGHDPTCALGPARYSPEMSRRPILVLIPDHRGRDFSQPTCDQGSVQVAKGR